MEKRAIIVSGAVLACTALLFGCAKKESEDMELPSWVNIKTEEVSEVVPEAVSAEPVSEEPVVEQKNFLGSWEACTENNQVLSEDELAVFEDGTSDLAALDVTPVKVLGKQVVSGTNTAYLVYGGYNDSREPKAFAIAVIYSDLNGENSMTSLVFIEPEDLKIKETEGALLGGWEVQTSGKAGMLPSQEAQMSFEDVAFTSTVTQNPVALLYTQLVSGMNYVAISTGSDEKLYLVKWYRNLEGMAFLTDMGVVDWEAYTQNN